MPPDVLDEIFPDEEGKVEEDELVIGEDTQEFDARM